MPRKRHDPPSRAADGRLKADVLVGRDPNRHYVYANPNEESAGLDAYLSMGYEVEEAREGGVRSAVKRTGKEASGAVTVRGQVLVSCPITEHEARMQDGWSYADTVDRRILKGGRVQGDGLRGSGYETNHWSDETKWNDQETT